jgi:hypothetical protein
VCVCVLLTLFYGGLRPPFTPPPTARPHELQFLYLLHLLHLLHVLHGHLLFRFLIVLSWREYVSFSSALMQQIKIANINANEPAITISSPINAGMLVMINSKYLCLFCLI